MGGEDGEGGAYEHGGRNRRGGAYGGGGGCSGGGGKECCGAGGKGEDIGSFMDEQTVMMGHVAVAEVAVVEKFLGVEVVGVVLGEVVAVEDMVGVVAV
ncbi:hypothetical protein DPMN_067608 [Dreissena polymorpha]|uniref:Uncharacterized protein n=1 Tax=Dreissena polymorpha TaxID=45954 RepID=A0A9D4BVY6_DREPO|nr:hypothetical protein DPMN_067608 [Dreissena polymorpha]